MAQRVTVLGLMLGVVACRPLSEVTDRPAPASLRVAWQVAAQAAADFEDRVALVEASARNGAEGSVLAAASGAALGSNGILDLGLLQPAQNLEIITVGRSAAGEVVYQGHQAVGTLGGGDVLEVDVTLEGLPAVQVTEVLGLAGDITVRFVLEDPEGDLCQLAVEYLGGQRGAFFGPATVDVSSVTDVAPGERELVWRSSHPDDEQGRTAIVQLRIIPTDTQSGFGGLSAPFAIDNREIIPQVPTPDPLLVLTADDTPELCWTNEFASGAVTYLLEVDAVASGARVLDEPQLSAACFVPENSLVGGRYVWRVAARNGLGVTSAFSDDAEFEIDTAPPPTPSLDALPSPLPGEVVTFGWGEVLDIGCLDHAPPRCAITYHFQLGASDTFVTGLVIDHEQESTALSWSPPASGGVFYYRVWARDAAGLDSPSGGPLAVTIDTTAPAAPVLAPLPTFTSNPEPTLSWIPVGADVVRFRVQIATEGTFTTGLVVDALTAPGDPALPERDWSGPYPQALTNREHAARVYAIDAAGNLSPSSQIVYFTVDTEPPADPTGCALDAAQCFQGMCPHVSTSTPTLTWDAPSDEVDHYRLDVSRFDGTAFQPQESIASFADASATNASIPSGSALASGAYELRLIAVDRTGTRSEGHDSCAVEVDLEPPDPPTLIGAYIPDGAQELVGSTWIVRPTIMFLPPAAPVGAPLWGYAFELTSAVSGSLSRCGWATAGGSGAPASACPTTVTAPVSAICPAAPTPANPCTITAAAELTTAADRIYSVELRALDVAGNASGPAALGAEYQALPVNQLYADVEAPPVTRPIMPTQCYFGTWTPPLRFGRDPVQNNAIDFEWEAPAGAPPAGYLFTATLAFGTSGRVPDTLCMQDCDGSVVCDEVGGAFDNCRLCSKVGGGETLWFDDCTPSPSPRCLRPRPGGQACAAEFALIEGWTCDIDADTCTYRTVVPTPHLHARMPDSGRDGNVYGTPIRWWAKAIDATGNVQADTALPVFACSGNGSLLAEFDLDLTPPTFGIFPESPNNTLPGGTPLTVDRPSFAFGVGGDVTDEDEITYEVEILEMVEASPPGSGTWGPGVERQREAFACPNGDLSCPSSQSCTGTCREVRFQNSVPDGVYPLAHADPRRRGQRDGLAAVLLRLRLRRRRAALRRLDLRERLAPPTGARVRLRGGRGRGRCAHPDAAVAASRRRVQRSGFHLHERRGVPGLPDRDLPTERWRSALDGPTGGPGAGWDAGHRATPLAESTALSAAVGARPADVLLLPRPRR